VFNSLFLLKLSPDYHYHRLFNFNIRIGRVKAISLQEPGFSLYFLRSMTGVLFLLFLLLLPFIYFSGFLDFEMNDDIEPGTCEINVTLPSGLNYSTNQTSYLSFPGELVWNRTYDNLDNSERCYSTWSDGIYIYTCGSTYIYTETSYNLSITKWDFNGQLVWNRTWGGPDDDFGYSIWGDGNFLYTCGYTESFGEGFGDLLLVKWNTTGNLIWNRTWGGHGTDWGRSIFWDGSYFYTGGVTCSFGAGDEDFLLVKWDSGGNLIWNRTWGRDGEDRCYSIWGDGTYIYMCGHTKNRFDDYGDLLVVKWNANGGLVWYKTWGHPDHWEIGRSIWGFGNNIYICGYKYDADYTDSYDLLLTKWNAQGDVVWNRTWGGFKDDYGYSICSNGTYFYTGGSTWSFDSVFSDLWLLKWDLSMIDYMSGDDDGDGLSRGEEIYIFGTNETDFDTDDDGLSDGDEVRVFGTNPLLFDTDGDGYSDGVEVNTYNSDPCNPDDPLLVRIVPLVIVVVIVMMLIIVPIIRTSMKRLRRRREEDVKLKSLKSDISSFLSRSAERLEAGSFNDAFRDARAALTFVRKNKLNQELKDAENMLTRVKDSWGSDIQRRLSAVRVVARTGRYGDALGQLEAIHDEVVDGELDKKIYTAVEAEIKATKDAWHSDISRQSFEARGLAVDDGQHLDALSRISRLRDEAAEAGFHDLVSMLEGLLGEIRDLHHQILIDRSEGVSALLEKAEFSAAMSLLSDLESEATDGGYSDLSVKFRERRELASRLQQLSKALSVSTRIKIDDIATVLELDRGRLMALLFDWSDRLGILIDGDYILNEKGADFSSFIADLDRQFSEWSKREKDKGGKI